MMQEFIHDDIYRYSQLLEILPNWLPDVHNINYAASWNVYSNARGRGQKQYWKTIFTYRKP